MRIDRRPFPYNGLLFPNLVMEELPTAGRPIANDNQRRVVSREVASDGLDSVMPCRVF